jgi:spore photoproduct lyase
MDLSKIFVLDEIAHMPIVQNISEQYAHIPMAQVSDSQEVYEYVSSARDPIAFGKKILFLTRNQGAFIRKCPGTREYICCGYQIIHIGTFCTMDCAYCILQSYFHPPVLQLFVNTDDLFDDLNKVIKNKNSGLQRLGTGEYTDSLIWEKVCHISQQLIRFFSNQTHSVLELKSKTTEINALLPLKHNRKTIMAWSVNTPEIIQRQEYRTTTLNARLKAAARCESFGFPLAFHFDPIILYDNCEHAYESVIDAIFSYVSANNIVWISLGTLRFMPDLKGIIQTRFQQSTIVYGEMFAGMDDKLRYFKPLRLKLYRRLVDRIKKYAPDVFVYYCMEDEAIWQKTMGYIPNDLVGGLPHLLDMQAEKICGINALKGNPLEINR